MAEVFEGNAKFNGKGQVGGVVMSGAQLVFYHKPVLVGQAAGGAAGGLLGALIGVGIDKALQRRREKRGEVKETINTTQLYQSFDPDTQKKLSGVELYIVVPREQIGSIKETFAGFSFETTQGPVEIKAKIKKKKMRQWLSEHGYNVPMS